MTRRTLAKMIVVFAALSGPATAADLDLPRPKAAPKIAPVSAPASSPAPAPASAPAPAADNHFTPPDAACIEWTDGCRVCTKPASGDATCSNPGIACTPRAVTCSRR